MKRIFCLFLTLVLLVGMVPVPAGATQNNAQVTNDEVTIEGTNGFGQLLSEDIQQQYQRETEYSGAYSVTDLTIAGNTAVVEYGAMEEAILVVAIYSEDGLQMITSGKTTVSPEATEATVTISNMPQYFMASAFLVDTYDYSPLCDSYETPMYTREMQELLASTIHDYDADRVLNLDEDETTNFAVYAEDTIVVEEQAGVNTVISADEESMTYVIGNADDTFLYLQPGDVVAYPYGEENFLFCKVAEIDVDGTTVTIQGEELEVEDVFSHMKIEGRSMGVAEIDESSADEGITYFTQAPYGLRNTDEPVSGSGSVSEEMAIEVKSQGATVSGSIGVEVEASFEYYSVDDQKHLELDLDTELSVALSISGTISVEKSLGKWLIPLVQLGPVNIVKLRIVPVFTASFSTEVELSGKLSFGSVYYFDSDEEMKKQNKPAAFSTELAVEGKFSIGIDLQPSVDVLYASVLHVALKMPVAFTITATLATENIHSQVTERHSCKRCLEIEFAVELEWEVRLVWFMKWDKTFSLPALSISLGDAYWSGDHDEFGWGTCPYLEYLVTIRTMDNEGKLVANAEITANGESAGATNGNGVLKTYLERGSYQIEAVRQEGDAVTQKLEVKEACSTKLIFQALKEEPGDGEGDGSGDGSSTEPTQPEKTTPGVFGTVGSSTITRPAEVPITGICGPNATFAFYSVSGLLTIRGAGLIDKDYLYYEEVSEDTIKPVVGQWPSGYIKEVKINEGITDIGALLFSHQSFLETVSIPETVTSIGEMAFIGNTNLKNLKLRGALDTCGYGIFMECTGLKSIYLPDDMTCIGEAMFSGCTGLSAVRIPETITEIRSNAFYRCESLSAITIPESISHLGNYVCSGCTNLKKIELPNNLTLIPDSMLSNCENLVEIEIPETVTSIGNWAFSHCVKLSGIDIPDSVKSIGDYAFIGCNGMTNFTFPSGITVISDSVLSNCQKITSVEIPNGVLSIGKNAFTHCKMLKDVIIPSTVMEIGEFAFAYTSIESINIPSGVKIGDEAFNESFRGSLAEGVGGALKEVWFMGDLPICVDTPFTCMDGEYNLLPIKGFYPAENPNWTHKNVSANNIHFIDEWHPYTIDENGNRIVDWKTWMPYEKAVAEEPAVDALIPAETGPETTTPEATVTEETIPETTTTLEEVTETIPETTEATVVETIPETTASVEIVAETIPETTAATIPETTAETETLTEPAGEQSLLDALLSPFVMEASAEEAVYDGEVHEPAVNGVFGGEYGAEETETYTLRTATFHDLVPGKQYVLLDMVSISGSDPLTASNLLTMDQGTADSSGTLVFEYVQRQDHEASYIVACGPSNQDLKEAFITFPDMEATDELQAINPTVDYYGDILKEGQDYVLLGQVSFTEAGEYVCFVRGIHQYTGLVKCTYTVGGQMRGDLNADGTVNIQDAIYLIWYTLFPTQYPLSVSGDMNRDNAVNDTDAVYLLWYILFPEVYPL